MVMESATRAFLFSVQRALPDELSPALAGVAIDTDERTLYIRCYFEGAVTPDEQEFMSYLKDAVWADFFPTIRVEVEAVDARLVVGLPAGEWVYRKSRQLVTA